MNITKGILLDLKAERKPIAVLAGYAVLFRLLFVAVGMALSPESMAAGLLQLCQPSQELAPQHSAPAHHPATCECGPVCPHGHVQFSDPAPEGFAVPQNDAHRAAFGITFSELIAPYQRLRLIRGPPDFLS